MRHDRLTRSQVIHHCGLAVECALKAYICARERFNEWPSQSSRRDLYTHDLRKLRTIAGIEIEPADALAASWHVMLQWDRAQDYDPKPTPKRVADSYFEAAFGTDGIATWLHQTLKKKL